MGRLMRELEPDPKGDGLPRRSTPPKAMKGSDLRHIERSTCRPGLSIMRDLAQSARVWVQLERQVFRISDERDKK